MANQLIDALDPTGPESPLSQIVPFIAAALRLEREETSMGAIQWFLFSDRSTTAKAKRAIAQKYCTRKHLERGKKGKR